MVLPSTVTFKSTGASLSASVKGITWDQNPVKNRISPVTVSVSAVGGAFICRTMGIDSPFLGAGNGGVGLNANHPCASATSLFWAVFTVTSALTGSGLSTVAEFRTVNVMFLSSFALALNDCGVLGFTSSERFLNKVNPVDLALLVYFIRTFPFLVSPLFVFFTLMVVGTLMESVTAVLAFGLIEIVDGCVVMFIILGSKSPSNTSSTV